MRYTKTIGYREFMGVFGAEAEAVDGSQIVSARVRKLNSAAEAIALLSLCGLMFVWPIGHTVALRNVFVGVGLILSVWLIFRREGPAWCRDLTWVAILLVLFTLWAVLVVALFSQNKALAFKEIRGQWLMTLVVFGLGALAAFASRGGTILTPATLLGGLWAITMVHVIVVDLQGAGEWLSTGQLPHRLPGLTPGAPSMSYYIAPFACLQIADVYCRMTLRRRLFPVSGRGMCVGVVGTLIAMYFVGVRNGTLTFLAVVATLSFLFGVASRGKLRGWIVALDVAAVLLMAAGIGYLSYRKDSRWEKFSGTLPLAWDTEHHKAWLDGHAYSRPLLPDGRPVDHSTYERVAWFKVSLMLVRDHPLGMGFGRHIFGQAVAQKYGTTTCGESHSGLLDIAIGTGIPGLVLWVAFLGVAVWVGWREYRTRQSALGLGLTVFVVASVLRMLVDSTQRDHMLQELMFLLGLLLVFVVNGARATREAT